MNLILYELKAPYLILSYFDFFIFHFMVSYSVIPKSFIVTECLCIRNIKWDNSEVMFWFNFIVTHGPSSRMICWAPPIKLFQIFSRPSSAIKNMVCGQPGRFKQKTREDSRKRYGAPGALREWTHVRRPDCRLKLNGSYIAH